MDNYLAIDYGTRRIGLAYTQNNIIFTLPQILNDKNLVSKIKIGIEYATTKPMVLNKPKLNSFNPLSNVSLNFSQNRHYGQRLIGETKRIYEKLDDVVMTRGDTKIAGTITSGLPSLKAASFSFRGNYDLLNRPVFTGIDFHVTPGTKLGELKSDSPEIMQNMRNYVRSYFEGNFI